MNIQNINTLANQLKSLGFGGMDYALAKRICFRPKAFCLPYRFEKGVFSLHFQLSFEKVGQTVDYALKFYDAAFQKAMLVQPAINGLDFSKLSQQMDEIDWKRAFDFSEQKNVVAGDKAAFENELKIGGIIDELEALETTLEGRSIAAKLKSTHWAGAAYHEMFGILPTQKIKAEVSQRFYVIEDEPGITVEEAFRYLQNRWQEREMLAKKKQADEARATTRPPEKGNGLLQKRRNRRTRIVNPKNKSEE